MLQKINVFLLMVITFLIPIHHKFIAPIIGLWIISSIVLIIRFKRKPQFKWPIVLIITYYVLLIFGLFWTDNLKVGVFDLEVKMSLFLFPLVMAFFQYRENEMKLILKAFYLGLTIGSLFLLGQAAWQYSNTGSVNKFFYAYLSPIIHPSYLSFYFVIGLAFLLIVLYQGRIKSSLNKKIAVALVCYFFVFNILILSKIGIVVATFIVLLFIILFAIQRKKIGIIIIGFSALIVVFFAAYHNSLYIQQRVVEFSKGLSAKSGNFSKGSTGIRIKIWNSSMALIQEKPIIGYGTGDVKSVLRDQYLVDGNLSAYDKQLNAHNQFLQTTIALGLLGLLLFLSIFIFGIGMGLKMHNYYLFSFLIISIVFMLPESILENQAGTIFFGLFLSLTNQNILFTNKNTEFE
ncbi:O-antigen ligase family protein [Putridiphycobacter roseus]|nr:O-antigen ligase family protein [Putridiphycobacter roseus]